MAPPRIRPMTAADVGPAAELLARGDWGPRDARASFFAFAVDQPTCGPIVAEADGELVGTGVGTANGPAGWVGTIFVDAAQRGRGLGRALTEAVIDNLVERGCVTLLLVATDLGRPVYERLGFAVQSRYVVHEIAGLGPAGASSPSMPMEPFRAPDLPAAATLDRHATGEDRSALLAGLLAASGPDAGQVLRVSAALAAFVLRPPWGGGATIAASQDAALAVLDARRRRAGPAGRVRAGVLEDNVAGLERLRADGWHEAWRAVRMARGAALDWRPEMIWGQFNFALG